MEILGEALVRYIDKHEGRMPQGGSLDEALEELSPYIKYDYLRYSCPLDTCPLGWGYERTPKRYEWNSSLAGRDVGSFSDKELDDMFLEKGPFWCPYHRGVSHLRVTCELIDYIRDEGDSDEPSEQD